MDLDAENPAIPHYDDGNRAFLQAIIARGALTLKDGKRILAAIFTAQEGRETLPEDVTEEDFKSYIDAASDALSPFDFEIRNAEHQVSKERSYAIVNSTSDPLTQIATTRGPDEISYIKRLLDAMFEKHNTPRQEIMGVTGMEALKLSKSGGRNRQSINASRLEDDEGEGASQVVDKGLKPSEAESLLASLVLEGWFERSLDGWYTLSPRALMELKNWLVAAYNEGEAEAGGEEWQRIKLCQACRNIITIGQRCSNLDCNVRLHDTCQAAFWVARREKKCPKCKKDWDGRHWVGEKVITTSEAYLRGQRRSGGSRRNEAVEDDAESDQATDD